MTRRRKNVDEILEELLQNLEPDRALRGDELVSLLSPGNLEPGDYRDERHLADGSVEIETFRVDEEGRIRDRKTSVEEPESQRPKRKKGSKPRTTKRRAE